MLNQPGPGPIADYCPEHYLFTSSCQQMCKQQNARPCNLSFVRIQEMAHHCPCSCHFRKGLGGPYLWLAGHQGFQASAPGIIHPLPYSFLPQLGPAAAQRPGLFPRPVHSSTPVTPPATQGSDSSSGKGSKADTPCTATSTPPKHPAISRAPLPHQTLSTR